MGWTFTPQDPDGNSNPVAFDFEGAPTRVHADGNNSAWSCASCGHPVLFVYLQGRIGSAEDDPTECAGCGKEYYLNPEWTPCDVEESVAPANPMNIIALNTPGLIEE